MTFVSLPTRASGGFPSLPPPAAEAVADGLRDLRLSLRALSRTLEPPLGGSSSRGIRVSPSRRRTPDVSTPGSRGSLRSDATTRHSRSALVVSHHLDGFLHIEVTGLLHPATGKGFATFHNCRPSRRPRALERRCAPRDAVHTLRRLPLASSRTASLRPLPSCRYRPARLVLRPGRSPHRPPPTEADDVHPILQPSSTVEHAPRDVSPALVEMNERLVLSEESTGHSRRTGVSSR